MYPLTNFIVLPVEMICSDEETQVTCDLVTIKGETFRQNFMTSDFSNLQRFKNILNKKTIALSFKGSESDLELLKEYVYDLEWVRKRGVKALGIYPYRRKLAFVTFKRRRGLRANWKRMTSTSTLKPRRLGRPSPGPATFGC